MAESFPPAPGKSEGSFPHRNEVSDDTPRQSSDTLLFRRYRVVRELGRGGMGVVLLAHDTALDIPVAVKLVPDLVVKDTEAVADLRKEVLRGMALNHDGVVRTHHFEKDESGAAIVMEFVEGDTLADLKAAQPHNCFDPTQIRPWLGQLCAVLEYAHREKHLIHRDLKPRNIMITKSGCLKVADFGIAAVISDSMSRHSMEGRVSGTLSYMSPQQAEGKRPSPLDDIHALGATIYELLTGKPPFFRGSQAAIFQQILAVIPPTMTARREELDVIGKAALPPQWEATIAACLAKDAAMRPQSAAEVIARLDAADRSNSPSLAATLPPIAYPAHVSASSPSHDEWSPYVGVWSGSAPVSGTKHSKGKTFDYSVERTLKLNISPGRVSTETSEGVLVYDPPPPGEAKQRLSAAQARGPFAAVLKGQSVRWAIDETTTDGWRRTGTCTLTINTDRATAVFEMSASSSHSNSQDVVRFSARGVMTRIS